MNNDRIDRIKKFKYKSSFWRFYASFHSFLFHFLYVYVFFFSICTAQDIDYPVETGRSNEARNVVTTVVCST